jgi:hypothetical protein
MLFVLSRPAQGMVPPYVYSICDDHTLITNQDAEQDIEATAGLQRASQASIHSRDLAVIELQPQPTFPLYFDTSTHQPLEADDNPGNARSITYIHPS